MQPRGDERGDTLGMRLSCMSVKLSAGLPERFNAILKQVEKSLLNL